MKIAGMTSLRSDKKDNFKGSVFDGKYDDALGSTPQATKPGESGIRVGLESRKCSFNCKRIPRIVKEEASQSGADRISQVFYPCTTGA